MRWLCHHDAKPARWQRGRESATSSCAASASSRRPVVSSSGQILIIRWRRLPSWSFAAAARSAAATSLFRLLSLIPVMLAVTFTTFIMFEPVARRSGHQHPRQRRHPRGHRGVPGVETSSTIRSPPATSAGSATRPRATWANRRSCGSRWPKASAAPCRSRSSSCSTPSCSPSFLAVPLGIYTAYRSGEPGRQHGVDLGLRRAGHPQLRAGHPPDLLRRPRWVLPVRTGLGDHILLPATGYVPISESVRRPLQSLGPAHVSPSAPARPSSTCACCGPT